MQSAFDDAAHAFVGWAGSFDPARETQASVLANLASIAGAKSETEQVLPAMRIFKPSERWQSVRRRVADWVVDGYATPLLTNEDGTSGTTCSVAYDIADFDELLRNAPDGEVDRARYFEYASWPYVQLRIRACALAVRAAAESGPEREDPFRRLHIFGKAIRFVTWRTNASTHASEDLESVRGASTICGGKLAFHEHTQQQWSCYACWDCYTLLRGKPHPYGRPEDPPERFRAGYVREPLTSGNLRPM